MKLVLAEKPSVAQSIAKVLGATKREDGYLEGNGYVVSWCVGHLVELSQPEAYDEKYNKWAYEDFQNVFDFNTRQTVNALGTAVNAVSSRMFGEIEKAIEAFEQTKTVERSHDYERNDLHTGRGLPDSGHRTEEHRNETVGQVRQNAEGVSAREQSDVAERSDSQRAAVPASPGDRRDSAPQSGAADDRTAGEESGTGQSNTADGMGEAHEQPESTGRGNRDSGAYQQLSLNLFLSESEQISFIDEAESKTLSAFSLSENQIDQVLTVGGNEANLRMMVALEYMKGKSTEEIAKRLPALYRGSNGFKLDSHEVSAWFDEQCIHLARGKTARFAPSRQIVSWQEAAERIGKLLENGEYATNVELVEAPGYERTKVAEFQNLAGLQNRYPQNQWQEILGNCDVQLFLGCTDQLTAEYVSQRTGIASVAVSSTSKALSTLRVSDYTPQYRESSGVGKRPVLTPDEVLRLPVDEALVILRGHKVLKVHKMDYSLHPAYKQLRECKASAHIPEWRKALPETLETPSVETKASPKAPPKRRGRPAKSKTVVSADKESIITKPENEKEIPHGNEQ